MNHFKHLSVAMVASGLFLSACAEQNRQPASPRPPYPLSSAPRSQDQCAAAERHIKAMQDIHQRWLHAKTPQERDALMAEHGSVMRNAMGAMETMHGTGMGSRGCMQAHHVQAQLAMMHMMMRMMMDRIDMLPSPPR